MNHYTKIQQERDIDALLQKTDDFIDRTNAMLDQFEADDKEWERREKALGFDFSKR